ncbi:MAG: hypothetical protein ACRENU_11865 [Gemmatimonadaceae bacterium]
MASIIDSVPASSRGGRPVDLAVTWTIATGLGATLAVVGWTDLALLWWPPRFGNAAWEFGTIGAHIAGMPLATIGTGLLSAAAIGRGWRRMARVLSIVSLLIAAATAALMVFYALDIAPAWRGVSEAARPALVKAVLKTSVFAVVYAATYIWLGRLLWRKSAAQ